MTTKNDKRKSLERALRCSYLAEQNFIESKTWQVNLMRDVRALGPLSHSSTAKFISGELLWSFARPISAIALVFTLYLARVGVTTDDELLQLAAAESNIDDLDNPLMKLEDIWP